MTWLPDDRIQAWSAFLLWWEARMKETSGQTGGVKDEAGAAWLAAAEWQDTLRGDE